jgi:hypothetical protein
MDFIIGLPKAQARDCIYVVVDCLTKIAHLFSISFEHKVAWVEYFFFNYIFRLYGLPRFTVSDRDNMFYSTFWQELFRLDGT